jgi:hypothetical protein
MPEKIQVYIRNKDVVVSEGYLRPVADHPCLDRSVSKTEKIVSEKDQQVLITTRDFADKHGLCIEVCDLATFTGKFRAFLKGVKTTPAILIRNSRIEGNFAQEDLRSRLECCLNQ